MNSTTFGIPKAALCLAMFAGWAAWGDITITQDRELPSDDASLEGESLVVDGATLTVSGVHRFASIQLVRGGVLTHPPGVGGVSVHVTGDVTIDGGAALHVDGRGYPSGGDRGPGRGQLADWAGAGAGHGGWGGHSVTGVEGGAPYGSILEPVAMGSQGGDSNGGPGAAGGGALRLIVDGRLTVEGRMGANGNGTVVSNAAGGSGGQSVGDGRNACGDRVDLSKRGSGGMGGRRRG